MNKEKMTLSEARETINHLVQGVDPYTGEVLSEVEFLHNPRMIRCFAVMSDLLTRIVEGEHKTLRSSKKPFQISKEEAESICFPTGDIGVKGIISAVNEAVDANAVGPLTILSLYKILKEIGVLKKEEMNGKGRTAITEQSGRYGIISVKSVYQNEEYDRILYTDKAKVFLKKQLPVWFPVS